MKPRLLGIALRILVVVVWAVRWDVCCALADDDRKVFEDALALAEDGQVESAVLKLLSMADAESAAVQVGRAEAQRVLKALREQGDAIPVARRRLVEGELLLALRDRDGALQAFREVAGKIAVTEGDGWNQGLLPRDRYFVEPPNEHVRGGMPALPFTMGPGSHRDNWLLRRFIALEAWDDAAKEFARVWELHRETLEPSVVQVATGYDKQGQPTGFDRWLVRPAGFSGAGLQFALDYAFFLQRPENLDRAREVLLEVALRIDMDRDPNRATWMLSLAARRLTPDEVPGQDGLPKLRPIEFVHRGHGIGVSRASFLRLAFGFLKTHGQEQRLVEQLTRRIEAGENRLRRVLAQVRLQQGEPDGATKLELEYIAAAKFDPVTTAYRRAAVFEAAQQIRDAVTECETVLSLLDRNDTDSKPWNFPDPAEPDPETDMRAARVSQFGLPFAGFVAGQPNQTAMLRGNLLSRLERLYSSLGETDKSLDATRRQILIGGIGRPVSAFDELARKHRAVGKGAEFLAWAKEQLGQMQDQMQDLNTRANLQWLVGDRQRAAESFAKVEQKYDLVAWKDRYRSAGPEALRILLTALIAANPKDSQSQLELLELDGNNDETRLAERLELLLEADPRRLFWRGKGARQNELPYKDQFEIAYRLMRLYERAKQFDKLQQLGVRIARGDKPFDQVDAGQYQYRDANALPESANGALALAIQWADTEQKTAELAAALEQTKWRAAKAQLARKLDESKSEPPASIGWANLPPGVSLIASNENVLSLTNDDQFVYAGHPWGVAVYDFTGKPITRIALGDAALTLATIVGESFHDLHSSGAALPKSSKGVPEKTTSKDDKTKDRPTESDRVLREGSARATQEHFVWVGTPKGLFRIARSDWSVAHQWMHDWMSPKGRESTFGPNENFPYSWLDNRVNTLTVDGDELWIGQQRTIQRLNMKTLELRAFSVEELKASSWADCERIVLDGRYVWADSNHSGLRRYDRETDEWSVPEPVGPREPVRLVEIVDGRVFGDVWVNDQLRHRLCLIDRQTLAISVIPVTAKKEEQLINSPLRFFGRYREQLVFGAYGPGYVLDDAHERDGASRRSAESPVASPMALTLDNT